MFAKLGAAIESVLDAILLVMISIMALSICWQVFARYALDDAPGWTEETARFLMAWITMLGSAVVLRSDGHIAVNALVDALPARVRAAVLLLRDAAILTMAGALAWYGYAFALIGGRRESAALEISMYWPHLAIPVGGVLIAILLLLRRAGSAAAPAGEETAP